MIYLDNASTTPLCHAAKQTILENLDEFGNPSSFYECGHKAKIKIEEAREKIASLINAQPNEIYFVSGGSEANNWAFKASNLEHRICSNIEHHSILNNPKALPLLCVDNNGIVPIDCIDNKNLKNVLISIMYVNNEIGVIEPIKSIAEIVHKNGGIFHTDAVQALPYMSIDVKELGVDMLSASGHKLFAPKGVGFIYIKSGTVIEPLIYGGKQEQNLRGGTENVLGILAMASAFEYITNHMEEHNYKIANSQRKLKEAVLAIPGAELNGASSEADRICSNINVRIENVSGADVVALCDQYGIAISTGSACNEGVVQPSKVLKAIGLSDNEALSSIRISIGAFNTEEEIDKVCILMPKIIKSIRTLA